MRGLFINTNGSYKFITGLDEHGIKRTLNSDRIGRINLGVLFYVLYDMDYKYDASRTQLDTNITELTECTTCTETTEIDFTPKIVESEKSSIQTRIMMFLSDGLLDAFEQTNPLPPVYKMGPILIFRRKVMSGKLKSLTDKDCKNIQIVLEEPNYDKRNARMDLDWLEINVSDYTAHMWWYLQAIADDINRD